MTSINECRWSSQCFMLTTSDLELILMTILGRCLCLYENESNVTCLLCNCVFQGNGRTLRQSRAARLLLNAHTEQRVSLQMLPRSFIDARSGSRVQRDELMTVLADVAALRVRAQLEDSAEGTLRSHGGLAHTNIKDKSSVWCLWQELKRIHSRLITSKISLFA